MYNINIYFVYILFNKKYFNVPNKKIKSQLHNPFAINQTLLLAVSTSLESLRYVTYGFNAPEYSLVTKDT